MTAMASSAAASLSSRRFTSRSWSGSLHAAGSICATIAKSRSPAMSWYLDTFFDRREGGIELIGGVHKWVMPCNWKFPAENFAGDGYHVPWSHISAVRTGSGGDFRMKPDAEGRALSLGNGHSIMTV